LGYFFGRVFRFSPLFLFLFFWMWYSSSPYFLYSCDDFSKGFVFIRVIIGIIILLYYNSVISMVMILFILVSFILLRLLWFLIVFEFILVPICLIIWAGVRGERFIGALYLLLFTLLFSVPFFLCVFKNIEEGFIGTSTINLINFSLEISILAIFVFITKYPVFLLHRWLPRAHVEAPTVGSIILAACILKLGSYGFLRFFPSLFLNFSFFFLVGVFGSLCSVILCITRRDLKALIAYSRVFHISYLFRGRFLIRERRILGVVSISCAHGFVAALMFFLIGSIYESTGSRSILLIRFISLGSVIRQIWFILIYLNFGIPISLPFISEILICGQWVFFSWTSSLLLFMALVLSGCFCLFWLFSIIGRKGTFLSQKSGLLEFVCIILLLIWSFFLWVVVF